MKDKNFEEFVMSICKPRGVVPSRTDWARMTELRRRHTAFAIVIGRMKKNRYLDIRPCPRYERSHMFAYLLMGEMRRGSAVIWVCYKSDHYLYLCNRENWGQVYREIVPPSMRPREVQVSECKPYQPAKKSAWSAPINVRNRWSPSDEDVNFHNPYRRKPAKRGFERTGFANRVMNYMIAF